LVFALLALTSVSGCSEEDPVDSEVSTVTDEGPYGGYSVGWYKKHWKTSTTDQRRWCRRQSEDTSQMQSCIDADIGWKQGWRDPETNPPRSWEDGPNLD